MIIDEKDRTLSNTVHMKMHTVWRSMIGRCYYEKNHSYKNYGALGVSVCDKWKTYDGFLDDVDKIENFNLELILKGKLQLDKDIKQKNRDYKDKIYSLRTCCWVSPSTNAGNRKNNRYIIAINLKTEDVILTNNREKLCRDYNLDSSSVWRILENNSGRTDNKNIVNKKTYKGFCFFYIEDFSMDKLPTFKRYLAENISTKEKIIFSNISRFSREFNLPYQSIRFCIKGIYKTTKGWKIKQIEDESYKSSTTIESKVNNLLKQVE